MKPYLVVVDLGDRPRPQGWMIVAADEHWAKALVEDQYSQSTRNDIKTIIAIPFDKLRYVGD